MFGRDHAGVGSYYGPYAAHEIFEQLPDLGITPVKTLAWHYCPRCGGAAYDGFCDHQEEKQALSGTRVRAVIEAGQQPADQNLPPRRLRSGAGLRHPLRRRLALRHPDLPPAAQPDLLPRTAIMSPAAAA